MSSKRGGGQSNR
nr:hypothetical protein [Tanacetum cinerariifolium]